MGINMKMKGMILSVAAILVIALFAFFSIMREKPEDRLDIVKVNNIVKSISDNWAELMIFTNSNEEYKEQLEGINAKAEQIDALITNMFHSTLEELQALSVSAAEVQSAVILNLIRYADYKKRVKPFELPDCIITE